MKKRRLHLYTAAMLFACTYSLHGQTTYTDGVFMLNEDWYGHNNSTLNFIRPDHPAIFSLSSSTGENMTQGRHIAVLQVLYHTKQ